MHLWHKRLVIVETIQMICSGIKRKVDWEYKQLVMAVVSVVGDDDDKKKIQVDRLT
jgi:hypothetical protein